MLHIIYGRSGTGKTEYVYRKISEISALGRQTVLIVPEQFTFETEKKIIDLLGEKEAAEIKVFSFSRLADEIFRIYGGKKKKILDERGKQIIMHVAAESVKDSLSYFKKTRMINMMCDAVTEFKEDNIGPDKVTGISATLKDPLCKKMTDIALVYSVYDSMLKDNYMENADILTVLAEILESNNYFSGMDVFFDSFEMLNRQMYRIIALIMRQANDVYYTVCTDGSTDELSFFMPLTKTMNDIADIAEDNNVAVDIPVHLDDTKRFKNREMKYLEENLLTDSTFVNDKFKGNPKNISIMEAYDTYSEIEMIACEIRRSVMSGEYRYGDISVICRNPELYYAPIENIFRKWEIPCFYSRPRRIDSEPLMRLVISLFEVCRSGYRTEELMNMLKTGLSPLDDKQLTELENYVYMWRITGSDWKETFSKSPAGLELPKDREKTEEKLNSLEDSRKRIIDPILQFDIKTKNGTATSISKDIYEFLEHFDTEEKIHVLDKKIDKKDNYLNTSKQSRIWKELMNILDQFNTVMGETEISRDDYYLMLKDILSKNEVMEIPELKDTVLFGISNQIRQNAVRETFLVGAVSGEFPKIPEQKGIFTNEDRRILKEKNFPIEGDMESQILIERYHAYAVATDASEKLFVSYHLSDGKSECRQSELIDSIEEIFPDIEVVKNSEHVYDNLTWEAAFSLMAQKYREINSKYESSLIEAIGENSQYSGRLESLKRIDDEEQFQLKNHETANKLFGTDVNLSASRIEKFYSCKFGYFCQYGIKAKERKPAEIDALKYGTVMHYIFENMMSRKDILSLNSHEMTTEISKLIDKYIEEQLGGKKVLSSRDLYMLNRLNKTAAVVISHMTEEMKESKFKPEYFELSLGESDNFPPLVIKDENGHNITISGKIDRMDFYEGKDGKYVRIIDYKTGNKTFKMSEVLFGLNLQMLIYLSAICRNEELIPAGILYVPSLPNDANADGESSEEVIKQKMNKSMEMNGAVLSEKEIENAMTIGNKPPFISKSTIELSKEDFNDIFKYIDRLIASMSVELSKGNIEAVPSAAEEYVCTYCPYSGVCGRSLDSDLLTPLNISDDEAIEKIRSEI
jgi:ATP-dependent helicase/nuclease subunit B